MRLNGRQGRSLMCRPVSDRSGAGSAYSNKWGLLETSARDNRCSRTLKLCRAAVPGEGSLERDAGTHSRWQCRFCFIHERTIPSTGMSSFPRQWESRRSLHGCLSCRSRCGARSAQSVHFWMHFLCIRGASGHPMAFNEGRFPTTFGFSHARE